MNQAENQQMRQYLLGMVSEDEAEQLELRLLSDPEYAEQFSIVVDEIGDEYVHGQFDGQELQQVEKVFFMSAERREKLDFAVALDRIQSERVHSRLRSSPKATSRRFYPLLKFYLPVAAAISIALVAGLGLWRWFYSHSPTDQALTALNAAYSQQRPTESRLSSFHYAPYDAKRGAENAAINEDELRRAELTLREQLREHPTPAVHHALGQVYLARRQVDEAIKQFDEAVAADSSNAVLHSDLGAAWLEKGKATVNAQDGKSFAAFSRSLDELNRALELEPDLLVALFNRALARNYLKLTDEAKADWEKYLTKDPSSGWANDARDNLKKLQNQERSSSENAKDLTLDFLSAFLENNASRGWELIRRNRDSAPAGKLIRDRLVDDFLQVSLSGEKDQADKTLRALTFAGQIESDQMQDVFTSQLARFYAHTSARQRDVLTNARQLMSVGQTYHGQSKPADAIPIFEKSKALFTEVNNSWEADHAELWIGYCHINAKNTAVAIGILARLVPYFERQRYKSLQMRALTLLAGAEYNFAEYSRAIEHNRRSLQIAEQLQDIRSAFSVLSILVEQYRYIGNFDEAIECIQRSLSLLGSCDLSAFQLGQYFTIIAAALSSANLNRAAVDYQQAAIKVLRNAGQVQTLSRAYTNLGSISGRLGSYDEGLQQATLGYETAKTLSDERVRKGMMAYSSQRIGDLHRQAGTLAKAIQNYNECVEIYESVNNHYGLYEAHKSLLLCHLASGDDAAAEQELGTALGLMEDYRSQILEQDNRNHFFGGEQSIYDLAIDYEYSRKHHAERAFDYSEASRSRSLLDLVKSNGTISPDAADSDKADIVFRSMSKPLAWHDIQSQIPPEVLLVQYAVLKKQLLIWVISTASLKCFPVPATEDELQQKVSRYVALLNAGPGSDEESVKLAKELFAWLIGPIETALDKNRTIYFVPDKALNIVPFNALVSPASGHFLIQDYSIAITPSSTLFITSTNRARVRPGSAGDKILSVGNPTFDQVEFPTLEDLPSARREAQEIARLYSNRTILIERQATRRSVQAEMERSQVIHLAVHSQVDSSLPLHSKLILAKAEGEGQQPSASYLEAQDIYKMNLGQARLVVLSSCESGTGKYYAGEGVMNLARPFLAANVPLVVASLWPVDSESTADLMISFYRYRRIEHLSTVAALRRAQLDLLNGPNAKARRVSSWAPFVVIGGWAEI